MLTGGRKWWRIAKLRRRVLNTEGVRSTSAGTCRGGGAAATVRHQQCFTRHVSLVPHVVDVVEVLAMSQEAPTPEDGSDDAVQCTQHQHEDEMELVDERQSLARGWLCRSRPT